MCENCPKLKTRSQYGLCVCALDLLPEVSTLRSLVATSLVKSEIFFHFVTWPRVGHVNDQRTMHGQSPPWSVNTSPSLVPIDLLQAET